MKNLHLQANRIAILSLLFLCFSLSGLAQTRELGIRASGLENFDFIYKKEKAPDTYTRFRFGFANISFRNVDTENLISANLGLAIGVENRKPINEHLSFVHGFEPFGVLGISSNSAQNTWNIQTGLGYILGFQYDISENFYVNAETIPSLSLGITGSGSSNTVLSVDAGFNSNAVALTFAYRFAPKSKN